jgi:hypothetical protein
MNNIMNNNSSESRTDIEFESIDEHNQKYSSFGR